MGGKSGTSTSQVSIPPQVLAQYETVNSMANQTAQTPFQSYGGQFVAPINQVQQSGIDQTQNYAQSAQPYYSLANYDTQLGQATAQPYYSAATQGVNQAAGLGYDANQNAYGTLNNAQATGAAGLAGAAGAYGTAYNTAQPYNTGSANLTQSALNAASSLNAGAGQGYVNAQNTGAAYNTAAAQGLTSALGSASPYNQGATALDLAGTQAVNAQQITPNSIFAFESPYIGAVTQSQEALLNQQNQQAQAGQLGNAITSGAFGGDRTGIAAANLQQQEDLANNSILSSSLNNAYSQALGAAQQQQGVNLGAGQANRAAVQTEGQNLAALGQQEYGQGTGTAEAIAALGQQAYGQQSGTASNLQSLGNTAFGEGLGAAGQLSNIGQNVNSQGNALASGLAGVAGQQYAQGANTAAQQAAIGQQQFGQGITTAGENATLGQDLFNIDQTTGQNIANLGSAAQTSGLQGAAAVQAAGATQQQTQQAQDTAEYNQFLQQQSYPFQVDQFLANIAEGTGSLSGSTTTQTSPGSVLATGGRVGKAGGGGLAASMDPGTMAAILQSQANMYGGYNAGLAGGSPATGGLYGGVQGRVPAPNVAMRELHPSQIRDNKIPSFTDQINSAAGATKSLKELGTAGKDAFDGVKKILNQNQPPAGGLGATENIDGVPNGGAGGPAPPSNQSAPATPASATNNVSADGSSPSPMATMPSVDDSGAGLGNIAPKYGNRGGRMARASGGGINPYGSTEDGQDLNIPDQQSNAPQLNPSKISGGSSQSGLGGLAAGLGQAAGLVNSVGTLANAAGTAGSFISSVLPALAAFKAGGRVGERAERALGGNVNLLPSPMDFTNQLLDAAQKQGLNGAAPAPEDVDIKPASDSDVNVSVKPNQDPTISGAVRVAKGLGASNAGIAGDEGLDQSLKTIASIEGTGKNPKSSAKGVYQITDPTFVSAYRQLQPEQARGMTNSQILAIRQTPDGDKLATEMGPYLAKQNALTLQKSGLPVNTETLYAAHLLGPVYAVHTLSADPATPLAKILPASFVTANQRLFQNKTAGDLQNEIEGLVNSHKPRGTFARGGGANSSSDAFDDSVDNLVGGGDDSVGDTSGSDDDLNSDGTPKRKPGLAVAAAAAPPPAAIEPPAPGPKAGLAGSMNIDGTDEPPPGPSAGVAGAAGSMNIDGMDATNQGTVNPPTSFSTRPKAAPTTAAGFAPLASPTDGDDGKETAPKGLAANAQKTAGSVVDWLKKPEHFLPLLSGAAAAVSAPTRNTFSALVLGAGAAGQSYQQQREFGLQQRQLDQTDAEIGTQRQLANQGQFANQTSRIEAQSAAMQRASLIYGALMQQFESNYDPLRGPVRNDANGNPVPLTHLNRSTGQSLTDAEYAAQRQTAIQAALAQAQKVAGVAGVNYNFDPTAMYGTVSAAGAPRGVPAALASQDADAPPPPPPPPQAGSASPAPPATAAPPVKTNASEQILSSTEKPASTYSMSQQDNSIPVYHAPSGQDPFALRKQAVVLRNRGYIDEAAKLDDQANSIISGQMPVRDTVTNGIIPFADIANRQAQQKARVQQASDVTGQLTNGASAWNSPATAAYKNALDDYIQLGARFGTNTSSPEFADAIGKLASIPGIQAMIPSDIKAYQSAVAAGRKDQAAITLYGAIGNALSHGAPGATLGQTQIAVPGPDAPPGARRDFAVQAKAQMLRQDQFYKDWAQEGSKVGDPVKWQRDWNATHTPKMYINLANKFPGVMVPRFAGMTDDEMSIAGAQPGAQPNVMKNPRSGATVYRWPDGSIRTAKPPG